MGAMALISLGPAGLWMLSRWYTSGRRCSKGRLWKDQRLLQTQTWMGQSRDICLLPSSSLLLWFERTQLGLELWLWLEAPAPALSLNPLSPGLSLLSSLRVQVEFYVNENTCKERLKLFFIKNQRSSESGAWRALGGEGWAGLGA